MSSSENDELSWHEKVQKKISHVLKEVDKESRGPDDEQDVENEVKQLIHQLCDIVLAKSDYLKEIADIKPGKVSNDQYKKLSEFDYDIERKKIVLRYCMVQYAPASDPQDLQTVITYRGATFGNQFCDEWMNFMCERYRLLEHCREISSFVESLYYEDLNKIEYAIQFFCEIEEKFSDEITRRKAKDPKWSSTYDKKTIEEEKLEAEYNEVVEKQNQRTEEWKKFFSEPEGCCNVS